MNGKTLIVAVCLITGFTAGWIGNGHRMEAEIAAIKTEAAEAKERFERDARQAEHKHAQRIAEIDKTYTEKLKNERNRNRAVVADLRRGAVQLRERFTCPDVSATGGTAGMGDGTAGRGLRSEDAEFLVSESGRADRIVTQLQACQDIIRADRTITAKDTDGTRQQ
ncbi:lysis protein [Oxalobacter aliiformigenes]|uniref:lysis system i-spanin subunit Rz n=1 Tax=Oxalobacter aliiformigenes TaxID=2946593 RepID=UPI0022AE760E|nr:lysis system i-spanin subunit Rz [Oxalobacter aliiformigenes]MCZ4065623.1 lysis protein [Oxalobacter aliiformigenes]WAV98363.1 lysis protein [Oxalobacter aliiformigenes]